MEHPCEKCGTQMEDGVPFCPSCSAPQIRVCIAPSRASKPAFTPDIPGEMETPSAQVAPAAIPGKVQWRLALPGAALAGFLLCLAMMVPFVSPFLLMIAAGGLAAALYAYRSPLPITAGQGARVGAVGGLFGFGVLAVLTTVQIALGGSRVVSQLKQAMADQLARNPDPNVQIVMDRLATPGGLAVILVFGGLIFLGVVLACSAIGGAVAGSLLGKKRRNI